MIMAFLSSACGTHLSPDSNTWSSIGSIFHTKSRKSCTASIISPKWLLASYHCISDLDKDLSPDAWLVFAGKDSTTPQNRHVKHLIAHPHTQFSQFHYKQDLVLVELLTALLLDEYINPTCISQDHEQVLDNCVIVGWTKNNKGIALSEPVKTVPAPIVDKTVCDSKEHFVGKLDSSDFCAGNLQDTADSCMLEGGAPLMCKNNDKWELKGILNYQSICKTGFGHHPSVFTSVPLNKKWIEKVMGIRPENSEVKTESSTEPNRDWKQVEDIVQSSSESPKLDGSSTEKSVLSSDSDVENKDQIVLPISESSPSTEAINDVKELEISSEKQPEEVPIVNVSEVKDMLITPEVQSTFVPSVEPQEAIDGAMEISNTPNKESIKNEDAEEMKLLGKVDVNSETPMLIVPMEDSAVSSMEAKNDEVEPMKTIDDQIQNVGTVEENANPSISDDSLIKETDQEDSKRTAPLIPIETIEMVSQEPFEKVETGESVSISTNPSSDSSDASLVSPIISEVSSVTTPMDNSSPNPEIIVNGDIETDTKLISDPISVVETIEKAISNEPEDLVVTNNENTDVKKESEMPSKPLINTSEESKILESSSIIPISPESVEIISSPETGAPILSPISSEAPLSADSPSETPDTIVNPSDFPVPEDGPKSDNVASEITSSSTENEMIPKLEPVVEPTATIGTELPSTEPSVEIISIQSTQESLATLESITSSSSNPASDAPLNETSSTAMVESETPDTPETPNAEVGPENVFRLIEEPSPSVTSSEQDSSPSQPDLSSSPSADIVMDETKILEPTSSSAPEIISSLQPTSDQTTPELVESIVATNPSLSVELANDSQPPSSSITPELVSEQSSNVPSELVDPIVPLNDTNAAIIAPESRR